MTTRRLRLAWRGAAERRATPGRHDREPRLSPRAIRRSASWPPRGQHRPLLMRALAVAGFAAGNVMLLSIGIWAGEVGRLLHDMGPATRDLLHWVSALIAMPAIAYAGRPFFDSALAALRQRRTNMDVPISLGVMLVTGMSLAETTHGGGTHLLRLSSHTAVLPADRPRAGPSCSRPGAGNRRATADAAGH